MKTAVKSICKNILTFFNLYAPAKKTLIFFGIYAPLMHMVNAEIKRKIHKKKEVPVLYYKKRFGCNVFVETGTYQGEMIDAMKRRFKKIYTIELGDVLYEKARERFINEKHVTIEHGDSGLILPGILAQITEPAIFWLDAHWSDGDTARGAHDTPIEQELDAIFAHSIKNHIILIDDARDFIGRNGYPAADVLEKKARAKNYAWVRRGDIFALYPASLHPELA